MSHANIYTHFWYFLAIFGIGPLARHLAISEPAAKNRTGLRFPAGEPSHKTDGSVVEMSRRKGIGGFGANEEALLGMLSSALKKYDMGIGFLNSAGEEPCMFYRELPTEPPGPGVDGDHLVLWKRPDGTDGAWEMVGSYCFAGSSPAERAAFLVGEVYRHRNESTQVRVQAFQFHPYPLQ